MNWRANIKESITIERILLMGNTLAVLYQVRQCTSFVALFKWLKIIANVCTNYAFSTLLLLSSLAHWLEQ